MTRIYSIDFLKLLFAILIAYSHLGINLPGADVAVVFFFILSGYFLARKYYMRSFGEKAKVYNEKAYTLDHIKTLYPHYILSLVVMFGYYVIKNIYYIVIQSDSAKSIGQLFVDLYELMPEFFLVQNIGFFNGGLNYPLWQMCALIISGYFIYALLCYNERLSTTIIFPISIILIQVYLLSISDIFGASGAIYIPLVRAFSSMCIGVLTYKFVQSKYYGQIMEKHFISINCLSIFSLFALFYFGAYQNIYLIMSVILIVTLVNKDSWLNFVLNRKCFKYFGDFSYAVYLNHALVIWILNDFALEITDIFHIAYNKWSSAIIFGIILIIYSIITTRIVKRIKEKIYSTVC